MTLLVAGLMAVCIIANDVGTVCEKEYSKAPAVSYTFFTMFSSLASLIFFLVNSKFQLHYNLSTVICGLIMSIGIIGALTCIVKAQNEGPLAITTLLFMLSMVTPVIYGVAVMHEPVKTLTLVGIAAFLVSLVLINFVKGEGKVSLKWAFWLTLAFLGNSLFVVVQKAHQNINHGQKGNELMILALSVACVILLVYTLTVDRKLVKKSFGKCYFPILHGTLNGANNLCIIIMATSANSSTVYPVITGVTLIGTSLISVLFYKEKLLVRQWVGVGFGILSAVLLSV